MASELIVTHDDKHVRVIWRGAEVLVSVETGDLWLSLMAPTDYRLESVQPASDVVRAVTAVCIPPVAE